MGEASMFSLDGRRAIVTGAGRGIGGAMARALVEADARVALVARDATALHRTQAALGAASAAVPFDLAGGAAMHRLVDRCERAMAGPVDIVVHAAGVQHRAPAEEFGDAEWQRVLDVNLTAPFRLSQEIARRQLRDDRAGSHIFVGSLTSVLSIPDVVAYTASKAAIYGVVRNLSLEWSGRGIRVNAIAPGYVRTELTEAVFADPDRRARLAQRIPLGRFGEPQDLAGAAVFLASEASAYVTGQLLMVDGGWSAG